MDDWGTNKRSCRFTSFEALSAGNKVVTSTNGERLRSRGKDIEKGRRNAGLVCCLDTEHVRGREVPLTFDRLAATQKTQRR